MAYKLDPHDSHPLARLQHYYYTNAILDTNST